MNSGVTGFQVPANVAFRSQYAYISDYKGLQVIKCLVSQANGALQDCANSGGSGFTDPGSITFKANAVFVTSYSTNSISRCRVNPDTGDF